MHVYVECGTQLKFGETRLIVLGNERRFATVVSLTVKLFDYIRSIVFVFQVLFRFDGVRNSESFRSRDREGIIWKIYMLFRTIGIFMRN